ncbi:MAG TPA: phosphonoacetaldehyde hydrolase [Caulobacteraceae bacterium]|nr:phosphonoacetaldehyde hydrolase [Caulobacteraceae bacterium]
MGVIKAVVFDWAGTMVDFGCQAPVEALIEAFAAEGVALSGEDARRDMGRAKRDHVAALLAWPKVAQAWAEAKGSAPTEVDVERVYRALEPLMAQAAARFSDLIPGAAAVASTLRAQGVRVGSGTGYTRQMMNGILGRAQAQGYSPEVVICAGETPSGRPSPLMLWQALVTLDAWPAQLCVKVDDAEVGIEEGRAAGCWSVGVAASGNGVGLSLEAFQALDDGERRARVERAAQSLRTAGAHLVIDTVADLPTGLVEIERRIASGQRPADG